MSGICCKRAVPLAPYQQISFLKKTPFQFPTFKVCAKHALAFVSFLFAGFSNDFIKLFKNKFNLNHFAMYTSQLIAMYIPLEANK